MVQRFPITLTQLSYFVECAKTLNMTEASRELHIAQSAVSTAINQLEKSLGATLFVRQRSKGLALTKTGEQLLRDTREIFGRINETIELVRADQREVQGSIDIACFKTITPFLLPQLLERLHQKHPELSVNVLEGDHEECIQALLSGRVELSLNYDLTQTDGIHATRVGEARPHAIIATSHRFARRKKVSLSELAEDSFVLLDLPDSREYFLNMLRVAGIVPNVHYRSSNYETVRSMVAMGRGFSILNQRPLISETYSGERTSIVEISDTVPTLHVTCSTLETSGRTSKVEAVIKAVEAVFEETHPDTTK